jgi:hypothetical protein
VPSCLKSAFTSTNIITSVSRDSSVGIALGYGLDDRVLGFDSRQGLGIFLFITTSRTALGPTPTSYPMGTRGSFLEGKAAGA